MTTEVGRPGSTAAPGEDCRRPAVAGVLQRARERERRTLADVAGQAGISASHLANIEAGRRMPSLPVALALDRALALTDSERARLGDAVLRPEHLRPRR